MDDTRDIAIRADESGKSAHKRLDGINGQIGRLSASHERMRDDFAERNALVLETVSDIAIEVVGIKTTLSNSLKVAGTIMAAAVTISTGLTVYGIEHMRTASRPAAPSVTPQAFAASVPHTQVLSRQRGSSGG